MFDKYKKKYEKVLAIIDHQIEVTQGVKNEYTEHLINDLKEEDANAEFLCDYWGPLIGGCKRELELLEWLKHQITHEGKEV